MSAKRGRPAGNRAARNHLRLVPIVAEGTDSPLEQQLQAFRVAAGATAAARSARSAQDVIDFVVSAGRTATTVGATCPEGMHPGSWQLLGAATTAAQRGADPETIIEFLVHVKERFGFVDVEEAAVPELEPLEIVEGKETRYVTVICPFCEGRHSHGWPYGDSEIGSRASDCGGGCYVVLTPEAAR